MTIREPSCDHRRTIYLDGPQGNAYYLLGTAHGLMRELAYDEADKNRIMEEMRSSHYKNLVKVFHREFGHIYILETTDKSLIKYIKENDK